MRNREERAAGIIYWRLPSNMIGPFSELGIDPYLEYASHQLGIFFPSPLYVRTHAPAALR